MFKPFKVVPLVLTAVAFALAGCRSGNNNLTLDDVLTHFRAQGVEMQLIQAADAPVMDSGMSVQVAGREIGIYKYNIDIAKQQQRLLWVRENGHLAVNGLLYPARINGSFIMIGYEKNPSKRQLIEAFDSFSK